MDIRRLVDNTCDDTCTTQVLLRKEEEDRGRLTAIDEVRFPSGLHGGWPGAARGFWASF